ncbi:MAG: DUF4054 domain-containing protein [Rhodospirillales bacterium]|nr:DUF4054 domain-containing protein [Rhodospirillales bacterium]
MSLPAYSDTAFRQQFPAFADSARYPNPLVAGYWTMGTAYVSPNNSLVWPQPAQAQLANDLMCAHLLALNDAQQAGNQAGVMTGATEGSVSVSLAPPPVPTAFQHWLQRTPYGSQLAALLQAVSRGGFIVGGSGERLAFRKAGGYF